MLSVGIGNLHEEQLAVFILKKSSLSTATLLGHNGYPNSNVPTYLLIMNLACLPHCMELSFIHVSSFTRQTLDGYLNHQTRKQKMLQYKHEWRAPESDGSDTKVPPPPPGVVCQVQSRASQSLIIRGCFNCSSFTGNDNVILGSDSDAVMSHYLKASIWIRPVHWTDIYYLVL